MFRSLAPADAPRVTIHINGNTFMAFRHATVAEALLEAGTLQFRRHPVSGEARGAHCLMGTCFECLVTINGVPGEQSCLHPVCEGMRIDTA